jgi:adenylate cyclase
VEIERKFLVREPPADLDVYPVEHIEQGYLVLEPGGGELRIRRSDGRAKLTLKQGSGLVRAEEELTLARDRFKRLWPLTAERRVVKSRYRVPDEAATIEVDVYAGRHTGLIVAEVEFASVRDSEEFEPPAWLSEELTGDDRYANRTLAVDGVPEELRAYRLGDDEHAGEGVRRIVRAQIDAAIGDLEGDEPDVHSARKHLKRARSALRLVRDELGDDVYQRENTALRDAGRRLSGARDAQVMVETLDELVDDGAFADLRSRLEAGRGKAPPVDDAVAELREVRARTAVWDLDAPEVPEAFLPGFERIYRRGRKALRRARKDPTDAALHELRKRVKDLWYVSEILRPAHPKRTKRLAKRADDLSDVLGDHNDVAVLSENAGSAELDELIAPRRAKLRRRALKDGKRLYARKSGRASRRIGLRV